MTMFYEQDSTDGWHRDDGKDGGWRKQEMVPEAGFYQSELRADGQLVLLPP